MRKFLAAVISAALLIALPSAAGGVPRLDSGFAAGTDGDNAWVQRNNDYWELDADTGVAFNQKANNTKTTAISVTAFIDAWYRVTGKVAGSTNFMVQLDCPPLYPHVYFGKGFVMKSVAWADGVAVSMIAPPDGTVADRPVQTGYATYVLQGEWRYQVDNGWLLANARVMTFEGGTTTSDIDTDPLTAPRYTITWTHELGAVSSWVAAPNDPRIYTATVSATGSGYAVCGGVGGAYDVVAPVNHLRWYTTLGVPRDDL